MSLRELCNKPLVTETFDGIGSGCICADLDTCLLDEAHKGMVVLNARIRRLEDVVRQLGKGARMTDVMVEQILRYARVGDE